MGITVEASYLRLWIDSFQFYCRFFDADSLPLVPCINSILQSYFLNVKVLKTLSSAFGSLVVSPPFSTAIPLILRDKRFHLLREGMKKHQL